MLDKPKTFVLSNAVNLFLDTVLSIANRKGPNTITKNDVSLMDHVNIMDLFVKVDCVPNLNRKKQEASRWHNATKSLLQLGGTAVADEFKDLVPQN